MTRLHLVRQQTTVAIPAGAVLTGDPSLLSAEASDLGLPPGFWPTHLDLEGTVFEREVPLNAIERSEEFTGYIYMDDSGRELRVYND